MSKTKAYDRLDPKERREQIMQAAIEAAKQHGIQNMQRDQIADIAKCGESTINKYYNTMTQLRRDVMRRAIKDEVYEVIAQGLMYKDPRALKLSDDIKKKALETMI
jgi:DNA-binding transcriptional regulator YbjK